MSLFRINQLLFIIITCVSFFPHLVESKDMSTLQTALTLAQEEVDKAKEQHEASEQAVVHQKQIVEDQAKQLAESNKLLDNLKMEDNEAAAHYVLAKKQYEKVQSAFKEAWDNNKK